MKHKLLLSITFISLSLLVIAQFADKTYAITGTAQNKFFWANIQQIDVNTGKTIKTLFDANRSAYKAIYLDKIDEAAVRQRLLYPVAGNRVAACALDRRHNRLYFAPMQFAEISYLDLNKPELNFTVIKTNIIAAENAKGYLNEDKHFTRMVIGADGNGYALTNDGHHLIRFGTGKKLVVEDLGSLVDDEKNANISIHNKCSSWGGDMVADAFGKLIIISANHNVFSVDVVTRVATHLGNISGLPSGYTTNGAVVNDAGNLVVSSANVVEGLYEVDIKNWQAKKITTGEIAFTASDLANANLLRQKEADDARALGLTRITPSEIYAVESAHVFPNPVTDNEFTVSFEGQRPGMYTVSFTDISGKIIFTKKVAIASKNQAEKIRFEKTPGKGMYLVKVTNVDKEVVFIDRIVVQ